MSWMSIYSNVLLVSDRIDAGMTALMLELVSVQCPVAEVHQNARSNVNSGPIMSDNLVLTVQELQN